MDTLLSVFQFGTPSFVHLRERIWLSVFEAAARDDISLIFTFAPESTVNPGFIESAIATVRQTGGEIYFVELVCPIEVLEQRIENPSREQFLKLRSLDTFRELRRKGADRFPKLPVDLSINTSILSPDQSAYGICQHFEIPMLSESNPVEPHPKP